MTAERAELQSAHGTHCSRCADEIPAMQLHDHPQVSICLECLSDQERDTLEKELGSAARVQRRLLPPRRIESDGWSIEYLWEPFGAVSGDHVDVMLPAEEGGPLHLFLGDVAGKGVGASLMQSQLHALFRALAPTQPKISDLLERTNRLFHQSTMDSCFATLAALRLYPDGRVALSNAGHPRPLLADRRGVRPVEDASLPLGVIPDANFHERELTLRPGESLLLYTDGLTEAERGGEEFGVGRAAAAFRHARTLPGSAVLTAARKALDAFLEGNGRGDDLTMVVVTRRDRV